MVLDNDTRGWILTAISGLACVLGALFICVDVVVRLFPGQKNFNIQDSNGFLSCSLSLSAGVMLFSALYKLLPESKDYLERGDFSSSAACWILIACFLAGVWGIQIISRVLHHFMPSHAVDCDHTHDEEEVVTETRRTSRSHVHQDMLETTSLLRDEDVDSRTNGVEMREAHNPSSDYGSLSRPSLPTRLTRKMTQLVSGEKSSCDLGGPCRGYSNPCGQDCFRTINARGGTRLPLSRNASVAVRPTLRHAASTTFKPILEATIAQPEFDSSRTPSSCREPVQIIHHDTTSNSHTSSPLDTSSHDHAHDHMHDSASQKDESQHHHHHVPENAFLSLSFQTSVALVLHKLPEGFITYASNHANPTLGFNVFMALAIHNITEGFCLALPIYLASTSRLRASLYSFFLGGFSQPLGAAVAAVWLHFAEKGRGEYAPSESVYGALFAVTSGILANVALNLLSQSFELTHNKGLCMFFVFLGMGILGVSSALTA